MNLLGSIVGFVTRPAYSRTVGILIAFILLAAVSLTVYVAQQQQDLRQRAAPKAYCDDSGNNDCSIGQECNINYLSCGEQEEDLCTGTCVSDSTATEAITPDVASTSICDSDADCPFSCNPTRTTKTCIGAGTQFAYCIYSSLIPGGGACKISDPNDTSCSLACPEGPILPTSTPTRVSTLPTQTPDITSTDSPTFPTSTPSSTGSNAGVCIYKSAVDALKQDYLNRTGSPAPTLLEVNVLASAYNLAQNSCKE